MLSTRPRIDWTSCHYTRSASSSLGSPPPSAKLGQPFWKIHNSRQFVAFQELFDKVSVIGYMDESPSFKFSRSTFSIVEVLRFANVEAR